MAKRQHKIKIFLSIVKIPCFCQKNSKNPEKLIVFQGFYSGQHFYPLNMAQRKGFEPLDTFLHHTISNRARSTAPPSLQYLLILQHTPEKSNRFCVLLQNKHRIFRCRYSKKTDAAASVFQKTIPSFQGRRAPQPSRPQRRPRQPRQKFPPPQPSLQPSPLPPSSWLPRSRPLLRPSSFVLS